MAITWGGYVHVINGVDLQIGIELAVSYPGGSLTSGDTTATVSGTLYARSKDGTCWDQASWATTGGIVASGSKYVDTSVSNPFTVGTFSKVVNLTYSTQSVAVTASLNNVALPDPPNVSQTITVGARPYTAPAVPGIPTATRVSDTQQTVTWTRAATTGAPYTKQEMGRREYTGTWSAWTTINANVSGSATSYADPTTVAGRRYQYRVRAVNSAGTSAWSVPSNEVHTTPTAPTAAPVAVRQGTSTVVLTRPALGGSATGWQVEHTPTPGTVTVSATIDASVDTFSHSPATSSTHKYRVRAVSDNPTLYSAWSPYSGTVALLSAPGAPTNLSPNGQVRDVPGGNLPVTWQHNPSDASPQTQYRLRRRPVGGTWTELSPVASTTQGGTLAGVTNGTDWEWAVATKGEHADFGPYSATATVTASAVPVASLVSFSPLDRPSATLDWAFFQASGRAQAAWQVQVQYSPTNETTNYVTFLDQAGTGTATAWTTPQVLKNGGPHRWRARVQDTTGQWSAWTQWSQDYWVNFTPPAAPSVNATWQDEGYVRLEIGADPVSGGPATVSLNVERSSTTPSVNEETEWTVLATGVPPGAEWQDWTAPLDAVLYYRVTAVSALPSIASTTVETVTPPTGWLYLGGGPDFSQAVRLERRASRNLTTGRERAARLYEGAESPVEVSGAAVPLALAVSAVLTSQEQRLALQAVFALPGPHLYRDGAQNTVLGTVSALSASPDHLGEASFSIERSWAGTWEQRQAAALAAQEAHVEEVEA